MQPSADSGFLERLGTVLLPGERGEKCAFQGFELGEPEHQPIEIIHFDHAAKGNSFKVGPGIRTR
jgi:hypothetical protein